MHDFRRLAVWQRAREFAIAIDIRTKSFPHADHGVVGGQLRRSAISIPANIAEGYSRFSGKDRARFYELALGSAREAREWYARLSGPLGAHAVAQRTDLLNHIIRILTYAIPEERSGSSERRMSARRKPGQG